MIASLSRLREEDFLSLFAETWELSGWVRMFATANTGIAPLAMKKAVETLLPSSVYNDRQQNHHQSPPYV